MNNLDLLKQLPISLDQYYEIRISIDRNRAIVGLDLEIIEVSPDLKTITVRIKQLSADNGIILNQSELTNRAGNILSPLNNKFRILYKPVVFIPDTDQINKEYLAQQMESYNLKASDLSRQLNIDKGTVSQLLSGDKPLTKWHKSTFYFYFLSYYMSFQIRSHQNTFNNQTKLNTMATQDFFRTVLPYGMEKNKEGKWMFFNREYVPVGWNQKDDFESMKLPIFSKFKGMSDTQIIKLVGNNQKDFDKNTNELKRVWFYRDNTNPMNGGSWDAYMKIIKSLSKIGAKLD